ncbi:MAG TPA: nucleoside deaminase [Burkholderiaceae bacterium]|nr:nucleoside deaminase [Burkholderiaceae bacterium]
MACACTRRAWLAGWACLALPGHLAAAAPEPIVQPAQPGPSAFAQRAFEMRNLAIARGDQPYGAVVVKDQRIVGQGVSAVVADNDPTAHAEMQAIRDAARRLGTRDLSGCELYGNSRACPMCEAAAYWARISKLRHGEAATDGGAPTLR